MQNFAKSENRKLTSAYVDARRAVGVSRNLKLFRWLLEQKVLMLIFSSADGRAVLVAARVCSCRPGRSFAASASHCSSKLIPADADEIVGVNIHEAEPSGLPNRKSAGQRSFRETVPSQGRAVSDAVVLDLDRSRSLFAIRVVNKGRMVRTPLEISVRVMPPARARESSDKGWRSP